MDSANLELFFLILAVKVKVGKVGVRSRVRPEGPLFNCYYTKV